MSSHLPSDQSVAAMTRRLARGDERAWRWLHDHYFDPIITVAMMEQWE